MGDSRSLKRTQLRLEDSVFSSNSVQGGPGQGGALYADAESECAVTGNVTITNVSSTNPSFKVATMTDAELEKAEANERQWEDLLDPKIANDDLLITEFDPFKDFIAIYCKRNGKPEIIVQDLDSKKYSIVNINDDIGTITAGMNQEYETKLLNFQF